MGLDWNKPINQTKVSKGATRTMALVCLAFGGILIVVGSAVLASAVSNSVGAVWTIICGLIMVGLGVVIDRDREFGKPEDAVSGGSKDPTHSS